MKKILVALLALVLLGTGGIALAVEEPSFELIEKSGDIDIREYRAMIVAQTMVDGDMNTAGNRGFRLIAAFIFGDNLSGSADGKGEKIAMTAPVEMELTPPRDGAAESTSMAFLYGSAGTGTPGPDPDDPSVVVEDVPELTVVSLGVRGSYREERFAEFVGTLEAWLAEHGLHWSSFGETCFYSDSLNDLPLLSKVARPVAVDPDETLREHALARGWEIGRAHV